MNSMFRERIIFIETTKQIFFNYKYFSTTNDRINKQSEEKVLKGTVKEK